MDEKQVRKRGLIALLVGASVPIIVFWVLIGAIWPVLICYVITGMVVYAVMFAMYWVYEGHFTWRAWRVLGRDEKT